MSGRHAARRCARDELFLLGHDEDHGYRPRIPPPSLAVGLAGALFVDLIAAGDVRAEHGHVAASSRFVRHDMNDPIGARAVADLAIASAWIPLSDAITGTAADLYERTLIHLITTDVITAKTRRFGRVRYRPSDENDVVHARHYPRRRVQTLDRASSRPDPATDAICALVRALRIESTLYLELPGDGLGARLDTITAQYATNHPAPHLAAIPDLIAAVATAISDVAVAVYR